MKLIQTLLSFAAAFTLGFALIACEEEKNEKAAATNESAFKYGTVEIPVSDGTLCIAPFLISCLLLIYGWFHTTTVLHRNPLVLIKYMDVIDRIANCDSRR